MKKKYDDETLEKVFYYYSLAGNRMLTAAQAADCLNLSESSLFRVIAGFREKISKEKEEELIQKYQSIDVHSVLNVKENTKIYSSEKSILEDIAITLAEILASINELKQYIITNEVHQEQSFLEDETDGPAWEVLDEQNYDIEEKQIREQQTEENEIEQNEIPSIEEVETPVKVQTKQHETIWQGDTEPTLEDLEKQLTKLKQEEKNENTVSSQKELNDIAVVCITLLNHMCKEINDLVPRENMEKMWNDWERICRGYGGRINTIYQRKWNQIKKKSKNKMSEEMIKMICDAQVEQMELELKSVSSQSAIKNISYVYYNWIRQVFEMCYLVQEPMPQEKTKAMYTTYLTTLKNISNQKIEKIK